MKTNNYNWQLQNVDDLEYIPDRSGIYVLIYWQVKTDNVRIDFMSDNHDPIISFAGSVENVRKAVGVWIDSRISQQTSDKFSASHIAYIGSELQKADIFRIDYIQDGELTIEKRTSDNKTDRELITKLMSDNKIQAEKILQKFSSDNDIVCSKCGYSKCGFSSDNILMCLDCGEKWSIDKSDNECSGNCDQCQ